MCYFERPLAPAKVGENLRSLAMCGARINKSPTYNISPGGRNGHGEINYGFLYILDLRCTRKEYLKVQVIYEIFVSA